MYDETLEKHASDLLHDDGLLRLQEQIQKNTAEVVRVVVRVSELVGDCIEHVIATLSIKTSDQNLEYVHACVVLELGHHSSFGLELRDPLATDVQHGRVDERHVVLGSSLLDLALGK